MTGGKDSMSNKILYFPHHHVKYCPRETDKNQGQVSYLLNILDEIDAFEANLQQQINEMLHLISDHPEKEKDCADKLVELASELSMKVHLASRLSLSLAQNLSCH